MASLGQVLPSDHVFVQCLIGDVKVILIIRLKVTLLGEDEKGIETAATQLHSFSWSQKESAKVFARYVRVFSL